MPWAPGGSRPRLAKTKRTAGLAGAACCVALYSWEKPIVFRKAEPLLSSPKEARRGEREGEAGRQEKQEK